MGLDWNALENAMRASVIRHAREVIDDHPEHTFYAIALHGVPTEPAETIEMPVLAMNSEEAYARDHREAEALSALEDPRIEDLDTALEEISGYYSERWDCSGWHWCAMELAGEEAASIWQRGLSEMIAKDGWSETIRTYYALMVRVIQDVTAELAVGKNQALIGFVADDDHAETLLKRCLTPEQLEQHFPDLVTAEREPASS
ncbi:DUF4303 domain-containing protein [Neomicrococcus aestuarii]|uniref:DUF4303 domain-containing protein n=1 Tax=Neomicrococcus aestuarii TaxID=556325 RepID=A0A1L2ZME6_9MICC|nr:DUF4303 domain-containing protein [Neomicrococcus aestuarii]APF40573.1 hypothetical protein BHE16_05560 [Neomicrococcus aestuarii]